MYKITHSLIIKFRLFHCIPFILISVRPLLSLHGLFRLHDTRPLQRRSRRSNRDNGHPDQGNVTEGSSRSRFRCSVDLHIWLRYLTDGNFTARWANYGWHIFLCQFQKGHTALLEGGIHWKPSRSNCFSVFDAGFLIDFISGPVSIGFTSAAAIIIATSQFKDILGLKFNEGKFLNVWRAIFNTIGQTRLWDAILGVACIVVLLLLRVNYLQNITPIRLNLTSRHF